MYHDHVISTLNRLIENCKDGEMGFRTCADGASNLELKSLFEERAQGCAQAALDLQEQVRRLGGLPDEGGSASGVLHRVWVDLRSAVTGTDDQTILAELERGEDVAVNRYRSALEEDLPPDIRNLVERQLQGAARNYDEIRNLHDCYRQRQLV
jgi:uncharacterized protein (TIGR02284 family)